MDSGSEDVRRYLMESQDHLGVATGSPCLFCRRDFTPYTVPSERFRFLFCRDCRLYLEIDMDSPSTASTESEPSRRMSLRRSGLSQAVVDIINGQFGEVIDPENEYESDASLDGIRYPNRDFFVGQGNDNHVSNDTDISPIHAAGQDQLTLDYRDYNEDDDIPSVVQQRNHDNHVIIDTDIISTMHSGAQDPWTSDYGDYSGDDIPSAVSRELSQRILQRQARSGISQAVGDIICQQFGELIDPTNEYESDASLDSYPNRDFFVGQENDNHVINDTDVSTMHDGDQDQWTSDYDNYSDDDSIWDTVFEEETSELVGGEGQGNDNHVINDTDVSTMHDGDRDQWTSDHDNYSDDDSIWDTVFEEETSDLVGGEGQGNGNHVVNDTDVSTMHDGDRDQWTSDHDNYSDDDSIRDTVFEEETSDLVGGEGQGNDNHVINDTDVSTMHDGDRDQWTSDYNNYSDDDDSIWDTVFEEETNDLVGSLRDIPNAGFHTLLRDRVFTYNPDIVTDYGMDEPELPRLFDDLGYYRDTISYDEQPFDILGDYLDTVSYEELIEHIEETDDARWWPPPAAGSCFRTLPLVVITRVHEKDGELICAVCTDPLPVGTQANHLPCMHFYHPLCIIPWLCKRNTCPVCRYELPTDDPEYEDSKRNNSRLGENSNVIATATGTEEEPVEFGQRSEAQNEVLVSEASEGDSNRHGGGRGWTRLAAAVAVPALGIFGMILVMWLEASLADESTNVLLEQETSST